MKKFRFAALFTASFLIFNSFSVFAAGNTSAQETEENVLTVEEATKKAIDFSRTIKKNNENIEITDDSLTSTITQLNSSSDYSDIVNLNVKLKEAYKNIVTYTANNEIEKEKIELDIIEIFSDIIKAENELELFEKDIAIKEKELKVTEVKASIGKISSSEYDSAVLSYNNSLSELSDKKQAIEKAYTQLNKILGIDDGEKYSVSLDILYEPLNDYDLDYEISRAISMNQNIKDIEKTVEITKYQLDTYTSATSKKQKEVTYAQSTRELTDAKTELKTSVTDQYNSVISSETFYESKLKELQQLQKELDILKVKYDIGSITETELLKKEYDLQKMTSDIDELIYEHYIQVRKLKNSNLL